MTCNVFSGTLNPTHFTSPAKMAETIEMLFRMLTPVGPRNDVLDGGLDAHM